MPISAEEPFLPFLNGLRQRGYHETALDYLASMQDSPMLTAEQREVIPLERALTLVDYSRAQRDIERRLQLLGEAERQLQEFVRSQSEHPKAFSARSELANMIVERARINLEQSKSGDTEQLLQQARNQFERAIDELNKLAEVVRAELDTIPKVLDTRDRKQASLARRRTQLRADNLQTELLAAAIREELAGTFDEGSDGQKEQLEMAAGQYDTIYKNYRSRLAGLYARMYQGRCNAQLGKTKDALAYYGDLLDQPDEPETMRRLKTETLRLAMDCWLAPNEKKYLEAIKQASEWMETVPRGFLRDADMLAIRLSLARAYQMQAEDFARREMDRNLISQSMLNARQHAEFVAGEEGPLREAAQALAEQLGSRQLETGPTEPTSFAEAAERGKESLDQIGPLTNQVRALQAQLRSGAGNATELGNRLAETEQSLSEAKSTAIASYRLAISLADASTPPTELNLARYFLCYLYYLEGEHERAAVVGEFVARQNPESDAALQCLKIALVSYNTMLQSAQAESGEGENQFEIDRIFDATMYLAKTWPETPDAVEVLSAAVPTMANAGQFDRARQLTETIPEDAPARWQADLITGHALRARYASKVVEIQQSGGEPSVEVADELDRLSADSLQFLMGGIGRLPEDPTVSAFNVTAMLLATETLLENSKGETAVQVIENSGLGPVPLMKANHPVMSDPLLRRQSLQLALRSYVASIDQGEVMINKAKSTMAELQQAVGADAAGQQQMLAIYVQLARSIEDQLKSAEGEEKRRLSQVFEAFLGSLAGGASDVGVLLWVAETYVSLGAGFDDDPQALNPMASQYYAKASDALTNLMSLAADPNLQRQVRARLADVKARQHDFAGSLEEYRQILQPKPNAVNLQVDAARMLTGWGRFDPDQYQRAIDGVGDGPGRTIWGWAKIASATMSHAELRETFYESRYEVARCHFLRAQTLAGANRQTAIADAKKVVRTTRQLYPDLANTKWAPLYTQLEKQIDSLR